MKRRIIARVERCLNENPNTEIAFLGLGKTNRAILGIIERLPRLNGITVLHDGDVTLPNIAVRADFPKHGAVLDGDLVFASPSVRRENFRIKKGTRLTSDTEIFFEEPPENTLLISGSDGKSTVSAMAAELLSEKFPGVFLGGNFGRPVALCDLSSTDAAVIELSSFNLQYTEPPSRRAIITNITPNHLDWHKSYEEYAEAKKRLIRKSKEPIVNVDTGICLEIAKSERLYAICSSLCEYGELRSGFSAEHIFTVEGGAICIDGEPYLKIGELRLKERHNVANFASALALTYGTADKNDALRVAHGFRGLMHRCDRFLEKDGITFIDSSIDTTPKRTAETLASLGKRVKILLGGRGKGLDTSPLGDALMRYADKIAVYGNVREEIAELLASNEKLRAVPSASFERFSDAVEYLTKELRCGDTVILSPAATSYGEFSSFEERGRRFRKIIQDKYEKI